ncbi:MAG: hypothetical protein HY680_10060 [Chloroflexi bacterium]|nr:hypothetical protein [Chloroflexota bacterium]
MRISIISEDRVFCALLARNLERGGHQVDCYLANWRRPLCFLASRGISATELWVLDMSWRLSTYLETYAILGRWCRELPRPAILLVDDSWDASAVAVFAAEASLVKPFSMVDFLSLVRRLGTDNQRWQGKSRRLPSPPFDRRTGKECPSLT